MISLSNIGIIIFICNFSVGVGLNVF